MQGATRNADHDSLVGDIVARRHTHGQHQGLPKRFQQDSATHAKGNARHSLIGEMPAKPKQIDRPRSLARVLREVAVWKQTGATARLFARWRETRHRLRETCQLVRSLARGVLQATDKRACNENCNQQFNHSCNRNHDRTCKDNCDQKLQRQVQARPQAAIATRTATATVETTTATRNRHHRNCNDSRKQQPPPEQLQRQLQPATVFFCRTTSSLSCVAARLVKRAAR